MASILIDLCDSEEEIVEVTPNDKSSSYSGRNFELSTARGDADKIVEAEYNVCRSTFSTVGLLFNHMHFYHGYKDLVKCPLCELVFASQENLQFHVKVVYPIFCEPSVETASYVCKLCGDKFNFLEGLTAHELVHTVEKKYAIAEENRSVSEIEKFTCFICLKSFLSEKTLVHHKKRKHGNLTRKIKRQKSGSHSRRYDPFSELGELDDSSSEDLHANDSELSKVNVKQKNEMSPEIADKPRKQQNDSSTKVAKNTKENSDSQRTSKKINTAKKSKNRIKCNVCNKTFDWLYLYMKHKELHSNVKKLSCKFCEEKFSYACNLKLHEFEHSEKHFKCRYCEIPLKSRKNLSSHEHKHRVSSSFLKQSYKKSDVRLHQRKCRKNISVTLKNKVSKNRVKVDDNMKVSNKIFSGFNEINLNIVQTEGKNFGSDEETDDSDVPLANLYRSGKHCKKNRNQLQDGNRPKRNYCEKRERYECQICDGKFMLHFEYVQHMETHDIKKEQSCSICKRSFAFGTNRKVHMLLSHYSGQIYYCEICRKPFNKESSMQIHFNYCKGVLHRRIENHSGSSKPYAEKEIQRSRKKIKTKRSKALKGFSLKEFFSCNIC